MPKSDTMAHRRRFAILAILAALGLIAAACGTDDESSSTEAPTTDAPTTEAPITTEAPDVGVDENGYPTATDPTQWALVFTGGTAGPADTTLDPIVIGWVNNEGGGAAFPEASVAARATAEFINTELGGAQGRPIELVMCNIATEEDGTACGTEMANNDDINFVISGVMNVGPASFTSALAGTKPEMIGLPTTGAGFTNPDGYAFGTGSLGELLVVSKFIENELPDAQNILLMVLGIDAATGAADGFFKAPLEAAGRTITQALIPLAATAPEVGTALQAAGIEEADLIVFISIQPHAMALYDTLQTLGLDTPALGASSMGDDTMQEHVGGPGTWPKGWYYGDRGFSEYVCTIDPKADGCNASGMNAFFAKVEQYGDSGNEPVKLSGQAVLGFGPLLNAVRILNTLPDIDNLTPDMMREAMKNFKGPAVLNPGEMECGWSEVFVALCGKYAGIEKSVTGTDMTPIASAHNGKAIDISPGL